jgi:hypothetical protein
MIAKFGHYKNGTASQHEEQDKPREHLARMPRLFKVNHAVNPAFDPTVGRTCCGRLHDLHTVTVTLPGNATARLGNIM